MDFSRDKQAEAHVEARGGNKCLLKESKRPGAAEVQEQPGTALLTFRLKVLIPDHPPEKSRHTAGCMGRGGGQPQAEGSWLDGWPGPWAPWEKSCRKEP